MEYDLQESLSLSTEQEIDMSIVAEALYHYMMFAATHPLQFIGCVIVGLAVVVRWAISNG